MADWPASVWTSAATLRCRPKWLECAWLRAAGPTVQSLEVAVDGSYAYLGAGGIQLAAPFGPVDNYGRTASRAGARYRTEAAIVIRGGLVSKACA